MSFAGQPLFPSVFLSMISDGRCGMSESKLFFGMFFSFSILRNEPLKSFTNDKGQISLCLFTADHQRDLQSIISENCPPSLHALWPSEVNACLRRNKSAQEFLGCLISSVERSVDEIRWERSFLPLLWVSPVSHESQTTPFNLLSLLDRPIVHHWSIGFVRGKTSLEEHLSRDALEFVGKAVGEYFIVFELLESDPMSTLIDRRSNWKRLNSMETIFLQRYVRRNSFIKVLIEIPSMIITDRKISPIEIQLEKNDRRGNDCLDDVFLFETMSNEAFAIVSSASKKSLSISLFPIERKIGRNLHFHWHDKMKCLFDRNDERIVEGNSTGSSSIRSLSLLNIGINRRKTVVTTKKRISTSPGNDDRPSFNNDKLQRTQHGQRSDLIDEIVHIENQRNFLISFHFQRRFSLSLLEIWRKIPHRSGRRGRGTFAETFAMIFKREKNWSEFLRFRCARCRKSPRNSKRKRRFSRAHLSEVDRGKQFGHSTRQIPGKASELANVDDC